MTCVKNGNIFRKRKKMILKIASGFRGSHSKLFLIAKQQVLKALKYSHIDRKIKNVIIDVYGSRK